jgi:hypothetical protein
MAKMKVLEPEVSGSVSGPEVIDVMTEEQKSERLAFLEDKRDTLVARLAKVESEINEIK